MAKKDEPVAATPEENAITGSAKETINENQSIKTSQTPNTSKARESA